MDKTLTTSGLSSRLADQLDRALDWLVAPGYGRLGFEVRRRSWAADEGLERLAGRDVLVTGAGSGIGAAGAARLLEAGAMVHVLARDDDGAERAARRTLDAAAAPSCAGRRLRAWGCDVSDLESVRAFADRFNAAVPVLHGLIHNAGVLTEHRELSRQGIELTFATHVLGPFALTRLLRGRLAAADGAEVVFVASGGLLTAQAKPEEAPTGPHPFEGKRAYAQAKRLQLILAGEISARWAADAIRARAMHPGWVDTPGLERSLPGFHRLLRPLLRTPAQGADTAVWLVAGGGEGDRSGALWHDRRPRSEHRLPWTSDPAGAGARLWERLAELSDPYAPNPTSNEATTNQGAT